MMYATNVRQRTEIDADAMSSPRLAHRSITVRSEAETKQTNGIAGRPDEHPLARRSLVRAYTHRSWGDDDHCI